MLERNTETMMNNTTPNLTSSYLPILNWHNQNPKLSATRITTVVLRSSHQWRGGEEQLYELPKNYTKQFKNVNQYTENKTLKL